MWDLGMSQYFGSESPLSEHPASPALLTSRGPHRHAVHTREEESSGHRIWPFANHGSSERARRHKGAASVGGSLGCAAALLLRLLSQTRSESRENGGRARASGRMYEEACLGRCCHALSQFENRSRTECPRRGLSCVALPDVTTCRWRCIRAQLS